MTDHHAQCWLLSNEHLTGRLPRWAIVIQDEHLRIVHKSGRLHSEADDLSRYPVQCGEEKVNEFNDNCLPLYITSIIYITPMLFITPIEVIKLSREVPTELKAAQ